MHFISSSLNTQFQRYGPIVTWVRIRAWPLFSILVLLTWLSELSWWPLTTSVNWRNCLSVKPYCFNLYFSCNLDKYDATILKAHQHYQIYDRNICKQALFQQNLCSTLKSGQTVIYTVVTKLTISHELCDQMWRNEVH